MDHPFMRPATDWVRHLEMLMKRVVVIVARLQRSHWAQPETRKVPCAMAPLKRDERAWRPGGRAEAAAIAARALSRRRAQPAGLKGKPVLELRKWGFRPSRARKAMFAVREGIAMAHPLAARVAHVAKGSARARLGGFFAEFKGTT